MRVILALFIVLGSASHASETTEKRVKEGELSSRLPRKIAFQDKTSKSTTDKPPKRPKQKRKIVIAKEGERRTLVTKDLEGLILRPDKGSTFNQLKIFEGDRLPVKIEEDMIGYGESKRAVRGVVYSGSLKGFVVLGHAEMDKRTKELVVFFSKIRSSTGEESHSFKGEMRLQGRHETKFWTYFWASVGANAIGGFADASKDREPTILGSRDVVSPSNVAKNSVAEGAKAGARVFIDELKNFPEFTVVMGPTLDNLIITETPNTSL